MNLSRILIPLTLGATLGAAPKPDAGALTVIDRDGHPAAECPLKRTEVDAEVAGFVARVTVTQEFVNTASDKVEAVYTFPLPNKAAVDDMTMIVGDRVIKGIIKRREEAQKIYEDARNKGQTAALLDQERPNIFQQAVTNIGPGMKVKVVIRYVETLKYEDGEYEFGFPMVVGPRYSPKGMAGAARITPPVAAKGMRAGHDIGLRLRLDPGLPMAEIQSPTHEVGIERQGRELAKVALKNQAEIPNRDFLLRWKVAGAGIEDTVLTHADKRGGFFALILQPPDKVKAAEVTPKEIVFVVDTSGSMHGFPIDKTKEVIKLALDGLHPRDTFNLITFAGDTHILFPEPVAATRENVAAAQRFLLSRRGSGGTEMMKAIRAALDPSDSAEHLRVVCFMTDGYVGNDMEIIAEIQKHRNARIFSFGVGSSVNRFLLDKMAEEGRGEVEYVGLNDDGSAAAKRFHERVRTPLLTDIRVEWAGLPVADVYPKLVPDVFSAKPVVLTGRYTRGARGTIRLTGKSAGREVTREIAVTLPANEPAREAIATLWARAEVEHLMSQDWGGIQRGSARPDVKEAITKLGLDFRLMTQFTSFVAVEESTIVEGGKPRVVQVPVEMPHGVSHEGVFGDAAAAPMALAMAKRQTFVRAMPSSPAPTVGGSPGRVFNEASVEAEPKADRAATQKMEPALASATGQVMVKVWLSEETEAVIAQLKQLGLKVTARKPGRIVLGTIDASKLAALAKLDKVFYISRDLGKP